MPDYEIASVRRAVRVLRQLAEEGASPVRVTDVARRQGISRDQAYRYLKTLGSDGLAEQVGDRWVCGDNLLILGYLALTMRVVTLGIIKKGMADESPRSGDKDEKGGQIDLRCVGECRDRERKAGATETG